jgi:hypothetical protein
MNARIEEIVHRKSKIVHLASNGVDATLIVPLRKI